MSASLARALCMLGAAGFLLAAAVGVAPRPSAAAVVEIGEAGAFVQRFGDEVIEFMRRRDLSPDAHQNRLRRILADNIDLKSLSRAVLGRYWRVATERQRARYEAIYPDYVVVVYGGIFKHYTDATLKVTRSKPASNGDMLVNGTVERPSGPPIKIAFRVRRTIDGFRVLDILVEGVSLLITQRSEFAALIKRESVEGFLKRLEEVTRRVSSTAEADRAGFEAMVIED